MSHIEPNRLLTKMSFSYYYVNEEATKELEGLVKLTVDAIGHQDYDFSANEIANAVVKVIESYNVNHSTKWS